eukprot:scaffold144_cov132-Isochrysis_galbana.AAC.2
MSAWWPRDATQNTGAAPPSGAKAGVMTVMSGRWEPPASCGWLDTSTSPGQMSPAHRACCTRTASCIAPRCTGMWGALATSPPCGSKMAQEKSSRSLMLVETEVRCSVRPICSAMPMNRCA